MTPKKLSKIKTQLLEMRRSPQGRTSRDFVEIARALGRELDTTRGKEPTWVRKVDPHLSPPLSIPNHSKEFKVGTACSILDALISDCDTWQIFHLEQEEEDENEQNHEQPKLTT